MRTAKDWKQFEVIDTSGGEKLERWGDVILTRPDPQVIWNTPKGDVWRKTNARYQRSSSGGGQWQVKNMPQESWSIEYKNLRFKISPTGFKHTGLFPEQAVNWDFMADKIKNAGRPVSVLNLFAYTGGATLACAAAGAKVCHVDASKGMVAWVWKLEDSIYDLVELCAQVLSDEPLFFLLNSYTTGLSPSVMEYILAVTVGRQHKGKVSSSEIGLPVTQSGCVLPCGSTAIWEAEPRRN